MKRRCFFLVWSLPLLANLAGCAGPSGHPRDPLEPMNRAIYGFNDKADRFVLKPVAETYRDVTPDPVRRSVRHFFSNLGDASSAVNYSLQAKPEPAYYSLSRFILNSTAGVLGLFDVTGEAARRYDQTGFGDTFARWGWKDSSYLVIPLLGPSTLRDGSGLLAGMAFQNNVMYGNPPDEAMLAASTVGMISTRESLLGLEEAIDGAALDPYSYTRDGWLQIRARSTGDSPLQSPDEDMDIDDLMQ